MKRKLIKLPFLLLLLPAMSAFSQTETGVKKEPASTTVQTGAATKVSSPCDEYSTDYYMTGMESTYHYYYETATVREDWYIFPNGDPNQPPYNPGEYCDGGQVFTDYADCALFRINGQVVGTFEYAWMIICQTAKTQAGYAESPLLSKDHPVNGFSKKAFIGNRTIIDKTPSLLPGARN